MSTLLDEKLHTTDMTERGLITFLKLWQPSTLLFQPLPNVYPVYHVRVADNKQRLILVMYISPYKLALAGLSQGVSTKHRIRTELKEYLNTSLPTGLDYIMSLVFENELYRQFAVGIHDKKTRKRYYGTKDFTALASRRRL